MGREGGGRRGGSPRLRFGARSSLIFGHDFAVVLGGVGVVVEVGFEVGDVGLEGAVSIWIGGRR